MNNHLFLGEENENGVRRPDCFWWRKNPKEFDENGDLKFKLNISDLSNLTPRFKVLREMERLALIADEGVDELMAKIMSYRAGDLWLPIGGLKKEEMDIPSMVTIVLTGLIGSGKSSFINLMCSVLGRSGIVPFAQTSGVSSSYTTMYLEEHNVLRSPRSGFCVYDTRGLDENLMEEGLDEVLTWMSDGVLHKQPCYRLGDEMVNRVGVGDSNGSMMGLTSSRYVKRKVNCVMVVADLSEVLEAFTCDDLKSVEALRDIFQLSAIRNYNKNPILILTHGDTLNADDRINGRLKVCEYLGIPEINGVYDIPCSTEHGILAEESDPVTAFALTEAVYQALLECDRTHLPKRKFKDWMILFLSSLMCFLASFFAILANFFSRFVDHGKKVRVRARF